MWSEQEYRITLGMSNLSDYAGCLDRALAWVFGTVSVYSILTPLTAPQTAVAFFRRFLIAKNEHHERYVLYLQSIVNFPS